MFYGVRNSVGVHDVSEVGSVEHMKFVCTYRDSGV